MSGTPRFLLDESVPKQVMRFLEAKGYSAEYASKGVRNGILGVLALERGWVLVSRDRDFINPVLFSPKQFLGPSA